MPAYKPTKYRGADGTDSVGARQINIVFNPRPGHQCSANVLVETYSGSRRAVHRVGSITLGVGRDDLAGLAPDAVTVLLVDHLQAWLSAHAATIPQPRSGSGAPLGATGGALQVPGQQSLNLDFRD